MIGKARLRNRRLLTSTAVIDKLIRLRRSSSCLILPWRGRLFVINQAFQPTLRRPGPVTIQFFRGSGIRAFAGPSAGVSDIITGFVFGLRRPSLVALNAARTTSAIPVGTNTLSITSGTKPEDGQWYFLRDNNKTEINQSDPDPAKWITRRCGGELVRVRSVSGAAFPYTVVLEEPTTQAYLSAADGGDPILAFLPDNAIVTPYLSVRGLRVHGERKSGFECWMIASLVANFRMAGSFCRDSYLTGFAIAYCRSVTISGCTGQHLLNTGAGSSYGFQIDHSVNVKVSNCIHVDSRYGAQIEGGSAACEFTGFLPLQVTVGAFDIHGGQAYNILFENMDTTACPNVVIGNSSWRRGADGVTVLGCKFNRMRLVTGIHNLTIEKCKGQVVKFEYDTKDPSATAWNGNPVNIAFVDTVLDSPNPNPDGRTVSMPVYASATDYQIDNLTFENCELINRLGSGVLWVQNNTKKTSSISFTDCILNNNIVAPSAVGLVFLENSAQTPATSLTVTVTSSKLVIKAGPATFSGSTAGVSTTLFVNGGGNQRGTSLGTLGAFSCATDVSNLAKHGPGC